MLFLWCIALGACYFMAFSFGCFCMAGCPGCFHIWHVALGAVLLGALGAKMPSALLLWQIALGA